MLYFGGFPNVATFGDNIATVNKGVSSFSGGTSTSSPIFASVVNLINEQQLNAAGKSSIEFINPALYSNPSLLNDITSRSNPGCGTKASQPSRGSVAIRYRGQGSMAYIQCK